MKADLPELASLILIIFTFGVMKPRTFSWKQRNEFIFNIHIIDRFLARLYICDQALPEEKYLKLLHGELNIFLENAPLNIRDWVWIMDDGAPLHS